MKAVVAQRKQIETLESDKKELMTTALAFEAERSETKNLKKEL